jgi:acylphosphatase
MIVCKRVCYSGRVQGVGFRYTCQRLAEGFAVGGYVRNLQSGDVEVWVEGEEDQVQGFLDSVARQMSGYIESSAVEDKPPQGFKSFSIRH